MKRIDKLFKASFILTDDCPQTRVIDNSHLPLVKNSQTTGDKIQVQRQSADENLVYTDRQLSADVCPL